MTQCNPQNLKSLQFLQLQELSFCATNYQLTKISIFFSPITQNFLYSYIWSNSEDSMTTVAKVSKVVLFCYQLTKTSIFSAQPNMDSYIVISSLNLKYLTTCSQSYQDCPFVLPAKQNFKTFGQGLKLIEIP